MSRTIEQAVGSALERYVGAETAEEMGRAFMNLAPLVQTPEAIRVLAEAARSSHKAHAETVEKLQDLVKAIEGGPNPLIPIVMAIGDDGFVASHGRGQYSRVASMLDLETGLPLVDRDEFEDRGPCIAALDPNGSLIVDAYWVDEEPDLFMLLLGQDVGRIESLDHDFDDEGHVQDGERVGDREAVHVN